MKKDKKNIIMCIILGVITCIYTILVATFDIEPIGPLESKVGFSTLNKFVFDLTGNISLWEYISDILVGISILVALTFIILTIYQLYKRKSIKRINKELIWMMIFYFLVGIIYIIFERVIINYRPILVDDILEVSFPSSHTLIGTFLCSSAILVNKRLFTNKKIKYINIILTIIMILIPITRLLSGVHWCSDIIGGILYSSLLLALFKMCLDKIRKKEK